MKVAITKNPDLDYCRDAPFHPQEKYPEYPFNDIGGNNPCYGEVRGLLYRLGLDKDNFGKSSWNPLGELIKPGDSVFIKPNFVSHFNPADSLECMITQGAVIRAALDYVYIALKGKGKIAIGDAPSIEADFDKITELTGLGKIAKYYGDQSIRPEVMDLRREKGQTHMGKLRVEPLKGDPLGYRVVDLKKDSALMDIIGDSGRFRANNYNRDYMLEHHGAEKNEYCIAGSVLDADVVINLPKLKTHCRTGITCALKNMVGINGYKSWLPHHRSGPPAAGGDEYENQDFRKDLIVKLYDEISSSTDMYRIMPMNTLARSLSLSKYIVPFKDNLYGGSWHGNDTIPRTISDLNRIVFYADKNGELKDTPQRKMLIIVDGIIGGEKEGPQAPSAKRSGILVAGYNPVDVDIVCSRIMGFDYTKMTTFEHAMGGKRYRVFSGRPEDIEVEAAGCHDIDGVFKAYNSHFTPPRGWMGHIEHEKVPVLTPVLSK